MSRRCRLSILGQHTYGNAHGRDENGNSHQRRDGFEFRETCGNIRRQVDAQGTALSLRQDLKVAPRLGRFDHTECVLLSRNGQINRIFCGDLNLVDGLLQGKKGGREAAFLFWTARIRVRLAAVSKCCRNHLPWQVSNPASMNHLRAAAWLVLLTSALLNAQTPAGASFSWRKSPIWEGAPIRSRTPRRPSVCLSMRLRPTCSKQSRTRA